MARTDRQSAMGEFKWYVDQEERVLRSDEVNNHHLIFPRWRYQKEVSLQQYRGSGGFLQRITVRSHNDLHRALEPPLMPNKNLRNEIIKLQFPMQEITPLLRLDTTIAYLGKIANHEPRSEYDRNPRDALALMDNLQRQREFIEIGRVSLLEDL